MLKHIKRVSEKIGQVPGTVIHVGEKRVEQVTVNLIDYDISHVEEKHLQGIEDCLSSKDTSTVTWLKINGLHETDIIEKIGKLFELHPLVMEDIVTTGQRPKIEDFDNYIFVVLKMLYFSERSHEIKAEQISFILAKNAVLSFQEEDGDVFDPLRERIRKAKGRIRKKGADYLLYALIDAIVDSYFEVLEKIGEKIEALEEQLISNPTPDTLKTLHGLRGEMIFLRKSIVPLREVVGNLERGEPELITEEVRIYFRDIYDHTVQVVETVETCRDLIAGMMDMYLSSMSNKMNEIMKVLTIIATIFIPLTFVAGIYGMNFKYMPELEWKWGYPIIWCLFIIVGCGMVAYFKKKKWL